MKKINRVREQGGAPSMETIGSLAVVMGFQPFIHHRCSSTYHYQILQDQGAWIMDQGRCDKYVTLFKMSLNCVRIVAEMCLKTATAGVSQGYRRVSQVSLKLSFLYTYVADRLELFQCSTKKCDNVARTAIPCDTFFQCAIPVRYPRYRSFEIN